MLNIPFCISCKHFHHKSVDTKTMTCDAFPKGIPGVILSNEMPHYLPVVGQVGGLRLRERLGEVFYLSIILLIFLSINSTVALIFLWGMGAIVCVFLFPLQEMWVKKGN